MHKITRKILLPFFILLYCLSPTEAQETSRVNTGEVSYITGTSIYVRFNTTRGLENGDTLYIFDNETHIPALLIQHHSSISCLCSALEGRSFKTGDKIMARPKQIYPETESPGIKEEVVDQDIHEQILTADETPGKEKGRTSQLAGRLAVSSYTNLVNEEGWNSQRFRYRFSMKALNIADSKLSAETYVSFTHRSGEWDQVQENIFNAMKVYSLAIKYDFNESTMLWAGRKINPAIANIGAVDGLQFQKSWKSMYFGMAAGSRPDYKDYGINTSLPEYGVYLGHRSQTDNGFIQSSLAFFEQRNSGNTDRRFAYFQHSNTLVKNLTFFSSFELDLFTLEEGVAKNTLSLTNMYLSLRYRVNRKLSIFTSYDNRKNVIYYETFRNYADEVLQQSIRQGYRVRITYRPIKYMNLGVSAGTRFRKDDPLPSSNARLYATYTKLPYIKGSVSLSAKLLQNSYLNGQVYGVRYSRDLIPGRLFLVAAYRKVFFDYINTESRLEQHIGEIDLSCHLGKKFYITGNFESTFDESSNQARVYLNLSKKF